MMMTLLAVLGGLTGLAVTASAVLLVWSVYAGRGGRKPAETGDEKTEKFSQSMDELWGKAAPRLLRLTFFDYALLVLFMIGSLFLFTDLIAVFRDAEHFPPYHAGYLLIGFLFTLAATLMMLLRLGMTLFLARANRGLAEHHEQEPSHTEHAE